MFTLCSLFVYYCLRKMLWKMSNLFTIICFLVLKKYFCTGLVKKEHQKNITPWSACYFYLKMSVSRILSTCGRPRLRTSPWCVVLTERTCWRISTGKLQPPLPSTNLLHLKFPPKLKELPRIHSKVELRKSHASKKLICKRYRKN